MGVQSSCDIVCISQHAFVCLQSVAAGLACLLFASLRRHDVQALGPDCADDKTSQWPLADPVVLSVIAVRCVSHTACLWPQSRFDPRSQCSESWRRPYPCQDASQLSYPEATITTEEALPDDIARDAIAVQTGLIALTYPSTTSSPRVVEMGTRSSRLTEMRPHGQRLTLCAIVVWSSWTDSINPVPAQSPS